MTTSAISDPDRPRMGRRSKLTPEVQERIATALRAGSYLEEAAQLAGVDRSTLWRWMAKGREARSGQFFDFCNVIQGAIAQAEVAAVARISAASQTDWKAAAWWLERGPAHQRWRPSLQLKLGDLSDAEIQAALDEVAQRLAGDAAAGGDGLLDD